MTMNGMATWKSNCSVGFQMMTGTHHCIVVVAYNRRPVR